jgi:glycosyltransferase involved in cell wall biosynthesis
MKLLIVSHTAHYIDENGQVVGWGPTVKEINALSTIFEEIIHLAPLHLGVAPKSSITYTNRVTYKSIKASGGKFLKKINILYRAPFNLIQLQTYSKEVDIIQFRAPTGIGLYILPYLKYCNKKKYWVKYAGNWVSTSLSLGNKFQKWWLQKMLSSHTKVTINGIWSNQKKHVLAFENPCLNEQDRIQGNLVVKDKQLLNKNSYCFVGGLDKNKGIDKIMEVFKELDEETIGSLHIVGDGILKKQLKKTASQIKIPIHFYGFLPKDEIQEIYNKCDFILLPSQSEGFPKVIGEAMNFGCIPIVSEVSCINQYIQHNYNGFLINPISNKNIKLMIEASSLMSNKDFTTQIAINYKIAEKFTYDYYLARIKEEIVDIV